MPYRKSHTPARIGAVAHRHPLRVGLARRDTERHPPAESIFEVAGTVRSPVRRSGWRAGGSRRLGLFGEAGRHAHHAHLPHGRHSGHGLVIKSREAGFVGGG